MDRSRTQSPGAWRYPELVARERHFWFAAYLLLPVLMLLLDASPVLHSGRTWWTVGGLISHLAFVGLGGLIFSLALVSASVRLRLALLKRRLDDRPTLQ